MDGASFALKLDDLVSGPAKKAADALRKVQETADKAQKSLGFSKELRRAEQQLNKIKLDPKGFRDLAKAQKDLAEQRKRINKDVGRESFGEAFRTKLGLGRLVTAAFFGDLLAEGLIAAIKEPLKLFAEGVKEAFKSGSQLEQLRLGYKLSLGKEGGAAALEDVNRFSKLTGMDDDTIAKMLLPLRRSGLSQGASRSAFAAASDLAAGFGQGGDEGAIGGFLEAFKRIQLKGGVTEKLLVNQLGVNAREFYESLGKQLGVSVDEAKKRAESGKMDPQRLLNTIYAGIEKRQGGQLGTGTIEFSKTFAGRLNKLKTLPEEYLKTIADSPGWKKLSDRLGSLFEQLSPESARGKKIIAKIQEFFGKFADWVDNALKPESIDRFLEVLGKIPEYLNSALKIGEAFAAIWVGSKIVDGIAAIGKSMPGMASGMLSVAAAAGAWAGAYERIAATADQIYGNRSGWSSFVDDLKVWSVQQQFGDSATAATGSNAGFGAYQEQNRRNLETLARSKAAVAGGGSNVSIAPNITVSVNGSHTGDASETGQIVGREASRELISSVEQSLQEAGL